MSGRREALITHTQPAGRNEARLPDSQTIRFPRSHRDLGPRAPTPRRPMALARGHPLAAKAQDAMLHACWVRASPQLCGLPSRNWPLPSTPWAAPAGGMLFRSPTLWEITSPPPLRRLPRDKGFSYSILFWQQMHLGSSPMRCAQAWVWSGLLPAGLHKESCVCSPRAHPPPPLDADPL